MSNPLTGIITSDFKALFNYAIDALLEDTALTVTCRITFGTTKNTECPNCILDTNARISSNAYKVGGPVSFATGSICPMCGGVGFVVSDNTTTLNLAVIPNDNRSKFIKTALRLNETDYYVQTISKADTFPTLQKAKEIVFDTSIEGYGRYIFERFGDPTPLNFGNTPYLVTHWVRK